MAVVDLLTAQAAAAAATAFGCDGITHKTAGLYGDGGAGLTERVGAMVTINGPDGYIPYTEDGKLIVLTQAKPSHVFTSSGTFIVQKPATTQLVGVFTDDGT